MSTGSLVDPAYQRRRAWIAEQAAGADNQPRSITYLESENQTWRHTKRALEDRWVDRAAPAILDARRRLGLPEDRVPQLHEVTSRLLPRSGFEFRAVPGLVPVDEFFGALAMGRFLSTQYVRHHGSPLYTPEPDILHEVLGHATCLADPALAMLHREAGAAMVRVQRPESRQFIANVFWFSAEFGALLTDSGPKAYGAGLLSSVGELDCFVERAEIRSLDIAAMGTVEYDIAKYQPVLFAGESLSEILDVVGEFFATATDASIAEIRSRCAVQGP